MIGERLLRAVLIACCLAAPSVGHGQGVVTALPAVVESVEPTYPEEAQAQGLTAEVGLEIDISAEGEVLDARVIEPAGHGFDEAAVEALLQFRFSPAEIDGVPTAVTIEYRLRFEIRQERAPVEAGGALRGLVRSREGGGPLAGALVDAEGAPLVETDADGHFSLEGLPPGPVHVVVVAADHERFETTEEIVAGMATEVVFHVEPSPRSPYESLIRGRREKKEVSTVTISQGELTRIPGTSGDTVKVIQNLPGLARAPFGAGVIIARGGNAHDTRAYVDGQFVPILFHFGGLNSVYSSELVEEVEFEPGNFGARYGRAIGGRVEIVTRDPGERDLRLVADADLYDATGFVETPISDDLSVAFAARRSYVDAVLSAATQVAPDAFEGMGFSVAPRFWDYQGKATYRVDEDNRLRLDVYGSSDRMAMSGESSGLAGDFAVDTTTAFSRVALTWDHRIDDATRTKLLLAPGWDHLAFAMDPLFLRLDAYSLTARADITHEVGPWLTLAAGLDLLLSDEKYAVQVPLPNEPDHIPPPDYRDRLVHFDLAVTTTQPAIWTEAVLSPFPSLELVPGLRLDGDTYLREVWFDPRFAARWAVADGTLLKGAVGLYHQPPPLQTMAPELGNPDLGVEGAVQYVAGVEQRLVGPLHFDVQLYYKQLFDLAVASTRVIGTGASQRQERYANDGEGRAYGAELLLRYDPDGRFFGWIGYSLTRSERWSRTGEVLASYADQPHHLIAVGTLELPELWEGFSVGARLRATSGGPYTPVEGSLYDADTDRHRRIGSTSARSLRLPAFFQLDVRVDKRWDLGGSSLSMYLDVQNVTNHSNAEGVMYNYDYSEHGPLPGLPFFPSLGIRWEL